MRTLSLMAIACAALMGLGLTLAAPQAQAVSCSVDEDCNDGLFCNGLEFCNAGTCDTSGPLCPTICNEQADMCVSAGRVTICHLGKKTISIGAGAIPAHLRHGDTLGPCP